MAFNSVEIASLFGFLQTTTLTRESQLSPEPQLKRCARDPTQGRLQHGTHIMHNPYGSTAPYEELTSEEHKPLKPTPRKATRRSPACPDQTNEARIFPPTTIDG